MVMTEKLKKMLRSSRCTDPKYFYTTKDILVDGEDLMWSDSFFQSFIEPARQGLLKKELIATDGHVGLFVDSEEEMPND